MPGPARIFQYYTDQELQEIFEEAKERQKHGGVVATGGSQKTGSFEYMDIRELLREINYELTIRSGNPRAQKVEQVTRPRSNSGVNLYESDC